MTHTHNRSPCCWPTHTVFCTWNNTQGSNVRTTNRIHSSGFSTEGTKLTVHPCIYSPSPLALQPLAAALDEKQPLGGRIERMDFQAIQFGKPVDSHWFASLRQNGGKCESLTTGHSLLRCVLFDLSCCSLGQRNLQYRHKNDAATVFARPQCCAFCPGVRPSICETPLKRNVQGWQKSGKTTYRSFSAGFAS